VQSFLSALPAALRFWSRLPVPFLAFEEDPLAVLVVDVRDRGLGTEVAVFRLADRPDGLGREVGGADTGGRRLRPGVAVGSSPGDLSAEIAEIIYFNEVEDHQGILA